ncbi:MAG: glycoside hydrolase family 3 C-terminal domain-containing protein [Bacteroidales bacterium]|nr:glycoside hydrolase family 3 C-terminal domain-containing protein [Bacteroidales bacterium]
MRIHKQSLLSILFIFVLLVCGCKGPGWEDPSLDPGRRADALLSTLTLEQKVGQLLCPLGWPMYEKVSDSEAVRSRAGEDFTGQMHGGSLWATFRADPWTQKTLDNGLNPSLASSLAYDWWTRDTIPLFLMEEAPHGHMAIGATTFPTGIGLASSWDTDLMERVGHAIGRELRAQGSNVGYGPVIDLAREPRWSRVEETYGEDPFLTAELAAGYVRGAAAEGVLTTLKHFVAYGIPSGGHNGNPSFVGERDLKECYLPPFKRAIEAGAGAVMTSYNSIDGVPSTGNEALLTGLLRDQWGFEGLVISDLVSIDGLAGTHRVAADRQEAAEMALKAGVDIDLGAGCYPLLVKSVRDGRIPESLVDRAARRVLRAKFASGMFDEPQGSPDPSVAGAAVHSPENVALALEAARKSVTLLENNGILPLKPGTRIALVGPDADNVYNQLGDYTAPQADGKVVTMLAGLQARGAKVAYAKGCAIRDTHGADITAAVSAARAADVVVAVVGGSSARDFRTSYETTGAAVTDAAAVSDMEAGEGFDRSSLDLLGLQPELLKALKATGKPLVVVYVEGRPLDKRWAAENADALITLWYPGEQGGNALAEVLFGDYNPAGRLPVSVPRDAGQLPVYYNQRRPAGHDYVEEPATPLYPFGYGLSYTRFTYGELTVAGSFPDVTASIDVTNAGSLDGEEVVQLYVIDKVASTVRPVKQLCGFARVAIPAGETRRVEIPIDRRCFEMVDVSGATVIEPGEFLLQAGASSRDILSEITLTYEK